MKLEKSSSARIPDQVIDVLKHGTIGYLSTISKSGELYSYPIAYYYSKNKIYFVTPVSAAKYKIIKNNPVVAFIVDNGKVTTEACGAMLQGRARIFTVGRTLISILSLGPKIVGFSNKYPGMLSFYARGKELPDERKLYKYRLIRINPTKIVYWIGYKFGRLTSKITDESNNSFDLPENEQGVEILSTLLQPTHETSNISIDQIDHDWLAHLDSSTSEGLVSKEERNILAGYKSARKTHSHSIRPIEVSDDEKRLLLKRKQAASIDSD